MRHDAQIGKFSAQLSLVDVLEHSTEMAELVISRLDVAMNFGDLDIVHDRLNGLPVAACRLRDPPPRLFCIAVANIHPLSSLPEPLFQVGSSGMSETKLSVIISCCPSLGNVGDGWEASLHRGSRPAMPRDRD